MENLSPIDWIICVGYLLVIIGLGFYFSRKQTGNDDYFFGGRKMHWLPVGLSLFAGSISANSFVGLPAEGAFGDYHQLLALFFIPFVVVPITCIWFVPFYKRMGFLSIYEYLQRRFSRPIRLFASLIFMAFLAGWMGTMLLAVTRILNVVLETPSTGQTLIMIAAVGLLATLYTALGGVKAVIWTDTIQAFALLGGMLFLLIVLIGRIDGGLATLLDVGASAGKFEMFRTDGGLGQRNVFSACAYGFFVYLSAQLANYAAYQRYVTVDSVQDVRRSLIIKGVFIFFTGVLFFLVGTALFVFYQQSDVEVFRAYSSGSSKDQLLPHFVVHHAGGYGLTGLILAGLFAAAMSSLDTGINSMTATVVEDWLNGRELGIRTNRCLTLGFGIAVTMTACVLSLIDSPVFDLFLSIAGATLGLLFAVLILGMLVPRANTVGAISGFIAGLAVFGVIRLWIPSLDDEALASLGVFAGLKSNTWWDSMLTTIPAFSVGALVSCFTAPPTNDQLDGLLLCRQSDREFGPSGT
jgi:SSS family transporter